MKNSYYENNYVSFIFHSINAIQEVGYIISTLVHFCNIMMSWEKKHNVYFKPGTLLKIALFTKCNSISDHKYKSLSLYPCILQGCEDISKECRQQVSCIQIAISCQGKALNTQKALRICRFTICNQYRMAYFCIYALKRWCITYSLQ